jgi:hypothetical protein
MGRVNFQTASNHKDRRLCYYLERETGLKHKCLINLVVKTQILTNTLLIPPPDLNQCSRSPWIGRQFYRLYR